MLRLYVYATTLTLLSPKYFLLVFALLSHYSLKYLLSHNTLTQYSHTTLSHNTLCFRRLVLQITRHACRNNKYIFSFLLMAVHSALECTAIPLAHQAAVS